ncbi:hypothetical protein T10_7677 [Trichinella papuae]|uniref:Uncharacterized protein n=1 Tax=Trichinella papuae TaxID=268474 RepID=A0A0V1LYC3_9BILA|nr:hypothetical protein T10_7677 [Trichinella papuae]
MCYIARYFILQLPSFFESNLEDVEISLLLRFIGILLSSTKSKQLCLLDYQIMVENRSMMTSEVYESSIR